MLLSRNSGYSAVNDVIDPDPVNAQEYGIDEEGPVPEEELEYQVVVPSSNISLSQPQEQILYDIGDAIKQSGDDNGILAYQVILQVAAVFSGGQANQDRQS